MVTAATLVVMVLVTVVVMKVRMEGKVVRGC